MKNNLTNYTIIFLLLFFSCNRNQEQITLSDIDLGPTQKLFQSKRYEKKCFYLHGGVGIGKTLIMDLF